MNQQSKLGNGRWRQVRKQLKNDWMLYVLLLPILLWYVIFCYLPREALHWHSATTAMIWACGTVLG